MTSPAEIPVHECLLRGPHIDHDWVYTSSGGGHMMDTWDDSGLERNQKWWHCPGKGVQPAPEADEREALTALADEWERVGGYGTIQAGKLRALLAHRSQPAPRPQRMTVKFDGGRRAVLDESRTIVGYLDGDVPAPRTVTAEEAWAEGYAASSDDRGWQAQGVKGRTANPYRITVEPTPNGD